MTCVNDKNNYLNNVNKDINSIHKLIVAKRNRKKNEEKLFLYNKNFDIYNDIMKNNYPNIYKVKFFNENNNNKKRTKSNRNVSELALKQNRPRNIVIENEDYYDDLIKHNMNNNENRPLERRKQSISGKIYEKEYYQEGGNRKRIIKSKYVEILPEKKDSIRAKLVKLNYSSRKTQTNNKYDFYGDNCSFLSKDHDIYDDDGFCQEGEFVSEVKRRNHIYKNSNNNILFLNTSLFKKKLEGIHEKENPSIMKVDELDINKTENKSWKQNVLQTQLETLNEANDKTKIPKHRRAESLENIDKNDCKYREILSTNSKLSYNDDIYEDEKITIFNNEYNEDDTVANDDNDVVEIKSREINLFSGDSGLHNESITYGEYSMNKRPSLVNHLYHYKQSKEIFNIPNKIVDRGTINKNIYQSVKNEIETPPIPKICNCFENYESDTNSVDEFLLDVDMNNNSLKLKKFSLKNCSEDCLDKMLMNYHDDRHKNKIRFNLDKNELTLDEKAKDSESNQTLPTSPDSSSKKGQRGKSPKTTSVKSTPQKGTSQKTSNQKSTSQKSPPQKAPKSPPQKAPKSPPQKSTKKSNSNIVTETNENDIKKKHNNVVINLPDHPMDDSLINTHSNTNIVDIPKAEPKKSTILDIDLIRPIKDEEIIEKINKNNDIPYNDKLISFRFFQLEINKIIQKVKENKEKKERDEIIRKKKEEDMELINLLKRMHEEHQQEGAIAQEQEAAKKGGKKIKRIPSDTQDKKGNSNLSPNNNNLTVNSNNTNGNNNEKGLSINSVFHISMLVNNMRNQVSNNKAKKPNDIIPENKNQLSIEEMEEIEEEALKEYKLKLEETKKKLQLDENHLVILKQYDENLKDKLRQRIKQNILKYEVLNIKKYYKNKDTINIYNMSSKHSNKIEFKSFKTISNAGSLMDFKTINKVDCSPLNSLTKSSYNNNYNIQNSNNDDNKKMNSSFNNYNINSSNVNSNNNNNNNDINNSIINKENSLLNSDFYKIFCKSHPSKFKNPVEQVKTVSDVTLPTIADYKNKLYYHNHRVIDLNKKEGNFTNTSSNNSNDNNNRIDPSVFSNMTRNKSLKSRNSINK